MQKPGRRKPPHQTPETRKLSKAREGKMTLAELLRASGLKCSVVSLSRKLSGWQAMSDAEMEAIARALGEPVTVERTTVTLGAAA